MARLDLPDKYRDEDLHGDAGNPGTRQVLAPPVKGGGSSEGPLEPSSGSSGAAPLGFSGSVDSPPMSDALRADKRSLTEPYQLDVYEVIALAEQDAA